MRPPPARAGTALRLGNLARGPQVCLGHHENLELPRRHRVTESDSGGIEKPRLQRRAVAEPLPQHPALAARER